MTEKSEHDKHDRDRDQASGKYVSDEYANAHPDTTTSEAVKPEMAQVRVFDNGDLGFKYHGKIYRGVFEVDEK